MFEFHEMKDIDNQQEEDQEGDQETSFINEGFDPSDDNTGIEDEVIISEERTQRIKRFTNHKNAEDFFTNILDLEPQCSNPKFVDYLTDSEIISIKRDSSLTGDYSVKYLGGDFQSIGMVGIFVYSK